MVKSWITIAVAVILMIGGTVFEQIYVRREFDNFSVALEQLYDKTENQTANKQDVMAFKDLWVKKKEKLHVFIPHNDIKEIELWIGETMAFVEEENYKEAVSKLEVLRLLVHELPKTFTFRLENIF